MSFFQALFHHLIDPMLIAMGVLASLIILGSKMRLIAAFTIGLIVELYFVMKHPGQDVSVFTLLTGSLAAYMWMVVGARLKSAFMKIKQK